MIYVTKDYQHVFFINLKCGYSTFEKLYKTGKILKLNKEYQNNVFYSEIFDKINIDSVTIWTIMRNPLSRLCSFYKDKFYNCFLEHNLQYRNQKCQIEMYKIYNKQKIENREFTISEFVDSINRGYIDDHIIPQSKLFSFNLFKKDINILQMEDIDFNKKCRDIIGIELLPKENVTNSSNIVLMESDKDILIKIYKEDIESFQKKIIVFDESKLAKNIIFI